MKSTDLVSLLFKRNIGPRHELVYGEEVVIDVVLATRWRIQQEDGTIDYLESRPKFVTGKDGWPKIEQVPCGELKFGRAKPDPLIR